MPYASMMMLGEKLLKEIKLPFKLDYCSILPTRKMMKKL